MRHLAQRRQRPELPPKLGRFSCLGGTLGGSSGIRDACASLRQVDTFCATANGLRALTQAGSEGMLDRAPPTSPTVLAVGCSLAETLQAEAQLFGALAVTEELHALDGEPVGSASREAADRAGSGSLGRAGRVEVQFRVVVMDRGVQFRLIERAFLAIDANGHTGPRREVDLSRLVVGRDRLLWQDNRLARLRIEGGDVSHATTSRDLCRRLPRAGRTLTKCATLRRSMVPWLALSQPFGLGDPKTERKVSRDAD